jgi:tetratricopeptide (TPR) repeat protein
MDRQTRRDIRHDKFVDEVGVLGEMARQNARYLSAIAGGVLVAIALVAAFYYYRASREQKAQGLLAEAISTMDASVQPQPGQPGPKFKDENEKTAKAEQQFKTVISSYPRSDAADVAGLYLARISASRGDVASARPKLEKFISDHPHDLLVGAARFSLYQVRIQSGEAKQVASELEQQLSASKTDLPADSELSLLAAAYRAQGNEVKTREVYRRIVTEFPDSPYAVEAQRMLPQA